MAGLFTDIQNDDGLINVQIIQFKKPGHFVAKETYGDHCSEECSAFHQMEIALNHYMNNDQMPNWGSKNPEIGEICVGWNKNIKSWYRVKVEGVLHTRTEGRAACCYLIDYGEPHPTISFTRLRDLPERFSTTNVPPQTKEFILWGIQPVTLKLQANQQFESGPCKRWDAATDKFINKLKRDYTSAKVQIKKIDGHGRSHCILWMRTVEGYVNVNQGLIDEGYACAAIEEPDTGYGTATDDEIQRPNKQLPPVDDTLFGYSEEAVDGGDSSEAFNSQIKSRPATKDIKGRGVVGETSSKQHLGTASKTSTWKGRGLQWAPNGEEAPVDRAESSYKGDNARFLTSPKSPSGKTSSSFDSRHSNNDESISMDRSQTRVTGHQGQGDSSSRGLASNIGGREEPFLPPNNGQGDNSSSLLKKMLSAESNQNKGRGRGISSLLLKDTKSAPVGRGKGIPGLSLKDTNTPQLGKGRGIPALSPKGKNSKHISREKGTSSPPKRDSKRELLNKGLAREFENSPPPLITESPPRESPPAQQRKKMSVCDRLLVSTGKAPEPQLQTGKCTRVSPTKEGKNMSWNKTSQHSSPRLSGTIGGQNMLCELNPGAVVRNYQKGVSTDSSSEGFVRDPKRKVHKDVLMDGDFFMQQAKRVQDLPFSSENLKKKIAGLEITTANLLQSYAWPALLRGRNFVGVAPRKKGKMLSYLLPIISCVTQPNTYAGLGEGLGPFALILCPYWKKARDVYDKCTFLLENQRTTIPLVIFGGGNEENLEVPLINGCDILIATPHCLLRMLEKKVTSLQRLCHLVLEDASELTEEFTAQIQEIMKIYEYECAKRQHGFNQMVMCSNQWSPGMESFMTTYIEDPLVVITSKSEAAIYGKVHYNVILPR